MSDVITLKSKPLEKGEQVCPKCGETRQKRGYSNHLLYCKGTLLTEIASNGDVGNKDLPKKEPEKDFKIEEEQKKLLDVAKKVLLIDEKKEEGKKDESDEPKPEKKSYIVEIIIGGVIIIAAMIAFFFFYDFGEGKEK